MAVQSYSPLQFKYSVVSEYLSSSPVPVLELTQKVFKGILKYALVESGIWREGLTKAQEAVGGAAPVVAFLGVFKSVGHVYQSFVELVFGNSRGEGLEDRGYTLLKKSSCLIMSVGYAVSLIAGFASKTLLANTACRVGGVFKSFSALLDIPESIQEVSRLGHNWSVYHDHNSGGDLEVEKQKTQGMWATALKITVQALKIIKSIASIAGFVLGLGIIWGLSWKISAIAFACSLVSSAIGVGSSLLDKSIVLPRLNIPGLVE